MLRTWAKNLVALVAITFASHAFAQNLAQTHDFVPGEVIVKIKNKPQSEQAQQFFGKAMSQKGMRLKRSWAGINMHKFAAKTSRPEDVQKLIEELKADPEVEYAEPN